MEIPKVFESEYRFCLILWAHEPISSTEVVNLCAKQLEWKKSTTFTVIRRLIERGILKNENSIVTSLFTKEEIQKSESQKFIEKTFNGSLPAFIASFTKSKTLTPEEIVEIRRMIDTYKED